MRRNGSNHLSTSFAKSRFGLIVAKDMIKHHFSVSLKKNCKKKELYSWFFSQQTSPFPCLIWVSYWNNPLCYGPLTETIISHKDWKFNRNCYTSRFAAIWSQTTPHNPALRHHNVLFAKLLQFLPQIKSSTRNNVTGCKQMTSARKSPIILRAIDFKII